MRISLLIVPFLLAASGGAVSAQVPGFPMPSPEAMQGVMTVARQTMNPAAVVLEHRQELALTPAQVTVLDSLAAPLNALTDAMFQAQSSGAMMAVMRAMTDPAAPIDENAVRAAFRAQADQQAEMMIQRVRAERRIAQILTPSQNEQRRQLQMNAAMEMMRALGAAATPPP
jgi:hypothetical protein